MYACVLTKQEATALFLCSIHQLFIFGEHLIKATQVQHKGIFLSITKGKKNNNLIIVTPHNLRENKAPSRVDTCFLFPTLKAHTGISMFKWQ